MKTIEKFEAHLKQISPRLRLSFDTKRGLFKIDQLEYNASWSRLFWIKTTPQRWMIDKIRRQDCQRWMVRGQLTKEGAEKWFAELNAGKEAHDAAQKKERLDWIDQDLRPRMAHAYSKSLWRKGSGYNLQKVKDFAKEQGGQM